MGVCACAHTVLCAWNDICECLLMDVGQTRKLQGLPGSGPVI